MSADHDDEAWSAHRNETMSRNIDISFVVRDAIATRQKLVESGARHFDTGAFIEELGRRVSAKTESQRAGSKPDLFAYLKGEAAPYLSSLGFDCETWENPVEGGPPFLFATRVEDASLATVLMYAHGDVVRGDDAKWAEGLEPWRVHVVGDRIYGRGTADNKGQHSVNLASLALTLRARGGRLGFNVKFLMEMGEEVGSPGLAQIAEQYRDELRADVFLASDGPRIDGVTPTLFLGSRGFINFTLGVRCRERSYHSGNWGGLLTNPAIRLTHAIATLVDDHGAIQLSQLKPAAIPAEVKGRIAGLSLNGSPGDPEIDDNWGEKGLTRTEKLYGWNSFEILAMTAGNPAAPVNAIPPTAQAHCQLRFVAGTEWENLDVALRGHFDRLGYDDVQVSIGERSPATRLSPNDKWVQFVERSVETTLSIPNHVFSDILQLPTVWIPQSYPGCSQHGPDEHMLSGIAREGLMLMTGLWWDLGDT
jgi:acetylornithine deacetylase/succinyl-diaminopimelate desuccinylase-like protein